jgi:hypothetical protein
MPDLELGSPEWWLDRLHRQLTARRPALDTLSAYYEGEHPLRFATERFRAAFGRVFDHLSDNWCGVVVDAVEERLNIQGFRIPQERDLPAQGPGDEAAWTIWQRNNLDAGAQMAHQEAFISGYCNVLVWVDADGKALITPESPLESIVEGVPGNRRMRAAALKEWRDDWTDRIMATVYLPDGLYKYISSGTYRSDPTTGSRVKWERRDVPGEEWPLPNPLEVVPMTTLHNRERLRDRSDSEIRGVIPQQDIVNKLVVDMLVASEYQSFRQRWATGVDIPMDPSTNQPIEPFKAAVDRLWTSPSPETSFGEFGQADLRIFVAAIEMFVQHIATQSRTPPHYFYLSGQFPSGESIKSAETGLVAKARRRMTHFADTWEDVLRLAFAVEDDPRSSVFDSEVLWADPESRSEAEHTDAMVKLAAIGVPHEGLWERWGFSPQEIQRFLEQRARQVVAVAAMTPSPNGQREEEEQGASQQPPVG